MISWKGNLVPSLSTIVSLSFLNNFELSLLCYRGTSFKVQGGSVIAAFFWAHNYVSEQFGNYVEYGMSIVLPLLGLLSRTNPHLQLIALVILHLRNPKLRYDIGFSVGAFTKINVCFVTPFWGCCQG